MEHKTFKTAWKNVVDGDEGIVEHIITVFGILDLGGDISHMGSFTKTLQEREKNVRVLDQHNTFSIMSAIGVPLEIREIGRDELPEQIQKEYPEATGGVKATTQYLLDTPEGAGAFARIKAGAIGEYSYGYDPIVSDWENVKSDDGEERQVRNLREIRLWEYSPVLWGMNQATMTTGVKEDEPGGVVEPEPEVEPEEKEEAPGEEVVEEEASETPAEQEPEGKVGRALSAVNEQRIRAALNELTTLLDGIYSQEGEDDEEEAPPKEAAVGEEASEDVIEEEVAGPEIPPTADDEEEKEKERLLQLLAVEDLELDMMEV